MRVLHSRWSWLKAMVAADSVAGNTLTGIVTRLTLRWPFHVGRAAICEPIGPFPPVVQGWAIPAPGKVYGLQFTVSGPAGTSARSRPAAPHYGTIAGLHMRVTVSPRQDQRRAPVAGARHADRGVSADRASRGVLRLPHLRSAACGVDRHRIKPNT